MRGKINEIEVEKTKSEVNAKVVKTSNEREKKVQRASQPASQQQTIGYNVSLMPINNNNKNYNQNKIEMPFDHTLAQNGSQFNCSIFAGPFDQMGFGALRFQNGTKCK